MLRLKVGWNRQMFQWLIFAKTAKDDPDYEGRQKALERLKEIAE
jgi:hypothetical protein